MMATTTSVHALELLNQLEPRQLAAVLQLLEAMSPTYEEDDSLGPAELQAVSDAEEWLKRNEPIPHEQVLAELGVSLEEWERMCNEPLSSETHP